MTMGYRPPTWKGKVPGSRNDDATNKSLTASCKSSMVIYLITCRRCSQQYVGKTGQQLYCRIKGHHYDILHGRTQDSPVAAHFNNDGHVQADMTVMVIDEVKSCDPCLQKIWESGCIRTLGTSFPFGMNLRVNSL